MRTIAVLLVVVLVLSIGANFYLYQELVGLKDRVALLEDKYSSITSGSAEIDELKSTLSTLEEQLSSLKDRINALEEQVKQQSPNQLVETINALKTRINELQDKIDSLEKSLDTLNNNYDTVAENMTKLYNNIAELYKLYNDLLEKYNELEKQVEEIKSSINKQQTPSGRGWDLIYEIQPWYFGASDPEEYRDFVLDIVALAPQLPEVKQLVQNLSIDPNESLLDKAWKIINYTTINLMYRRDAYVRIPLPNGSVIVWHDELQLPNETLREHGVFGGGDCEDLALLVYAVLKTVAKQGEEIYLIIANDPVEGHVAVLAIDKNVHEAYIIDPSIGMINGYVEMIQIHAEDKNNNTGARQMIATIIAPALKTAILQLLKAEIVYVDYYTYLTTHQKTVETTPKTHHADPQKLLEIWKTVMGLQPTSYTIITNTDITTYTEQELIQWIQTEVV